jgi:predicted transport protein
MNKTFAEFTRHIEKSDYLSSLKGHFYQLKSYRRFPSDAEFKSVLLYRDVYNFMHRSYLLRKLENFGKKEFVSVENYTIEHVLPQNPNLGIEWQNELGEDWKAIQERYLHTIGNLTLTGYNSEYSDRPFSEKKSMKGGFLESPLKLNKAIAAQEKWNETAILERANQISDETLKIWQSPTLSQEEIAKWAKAPDPEKQQTTYSIDDHEYLARPNVRELFDALRAEVMKMDPEVSETFLKYWIAYKVNTNFVDVVPKAKGLRLSINMRYPEISDPAGMTEDISEKGRWGNGDVSVHYRRLEDLPYIMGLIRQSYEKQLS